MSGGGDTRVSIPHHARKLIHEVKKTIGPKHSDEFMYTTFKDCDMDPKEACRRLKMIHEIKEIASKHNAEDVYTMLKDCNMDPNEAAQRLLYIDTFHEVKKKHDRRKSISSDTSDDYKRTQGNQWQRNFSSGREYGGTNRQERASRLTTPVHSEKDNNGARVAKSVANGNGTLVISNGSYSQKLAPKSSSTSDTVVVSSKNTCAIGTIQCEIVKRSGSTKSNSRPSAGIKFSANQVVADSIPVIEEAADSDKARHLESDVVEKIQISESLKHLSTKSNSRPSAGIKFSANQVVADSIPVIEEAADSDKARQLESDVVEKIQISESLKHLSLSTQVSSQVVNPNLDNQPPQLLNEPLKEVMEPISIINTHLIPEEKSELKLPSRKPDVTLSSHQTVIFPDHFQVPENFKNHFTFGSLDATPDDSQHLPATESVQKDDVIVPEPSLNDNISSDPAQNHEPSSEDNISSDPAQKLEQTKVEMMSPLGFQNQVLQRDYNFGFMPHVMGPHFVHLDVPELQSGGSVVTSGLSQTPTTQPTTAGHNSSPSVFPYFRQPYPNYIPYNPYFPHLYLPQNAHLFNHGPFPHQPPPSGVKFSAPPQFKQGTTAGNFTPNQDITVSQEKDNSLPPPVQQGEDQQVWAQGRDVPNLVPGPYFYNFPPQGHPMAFSPLQAGIYPSTVQAPVMYQAQSTSGTRETMVPPQQPPSQSNWNTTLPNRETS